MQKYSPEHERKMKLHYHSLSEKDRRRYAAIEALKLGYGGKTYIANLFCCSRKTILTGIREIQQEERVSQRSTAICKEGEYVEMDPIFDFDAPKISRVHYISKVDIDEEPLTIIRSLLAQPLKKLYPVPSNRIRRAGGGRKRVLDTTPIIHDVFHEVVREFTAGSPMKEKIKWTNLTLDEIAELMTARGVEVSRYIVKQLLMYHGFKKRKGRKCKSYKYVEYRDDQFKYINELKFSYTESGDPVVCIDTKKKEYIGNYYRDGELYCIEPHYNWDHDFASYSEGVMIPYGLYDVFHNHCSVYIGVSKDTSEFVCDNIRAWWKDYGQKMYPNSKRLLILADSGGSNSSRHHIFKQDLQQVANDIGIEIRMAHYPPYASKYNPIEHRVFCHITRACQGVVFTSIDLVKELIAKAKTKTGLKVEAKVVTKEYEIGRKATQEFKENMPIVFDDFLGQWNYTAVPQ